MKNVRRIPSYIVPTTTIEFDNMIISPSTPVTVFDDWNRENWSGSLLVEEEGLKGTMDRWVYLHSLLSDSRLPLYAFQAFGHSESDFNVSDFDASKHPGVHPREIRFDPNDVLPAAYLEREQDPEAVVAYTDVHREYQLTNVVFQAALRNYFLAQDINYHNRLRSINPSYWQVVMLIAAMEALLPKPGYCKGHCEVCSKGVYHVLIDANKNWNDLLFDKIKDSQIKKQYRLVFDVARREIRNNTVHNGLMPTLILSRGSLADGITEFTTQKAIREYMSNGYSLESLVEQLRQLCRYTLLNRLIKKDVFPPLKGIEIHSKIIRNIASSSKAMKLDF